MNRTRTLGGVVTAGAFMSYVVGIWIAYPGRALSVGAFMLGATLVAVGGEHE